MARRIAARELLARFLQRNELSAADLGRAVQVSRVTVHEWLKGSRRPSDPHRAMLEKWTGGAVPFNAWTADAAATRSGD